MKIKVIKKDGTYQEWLPDKIRHAVSLSAERTKNVLSEDDKDKIVLLVEKQIKEDGIKVVNVLELHERVMSVLFDINHEIYTEYRAYRNYKERFTKSFENTYEFANKVVTLGDKENANKDSTLNSTKQALISEGSMKEFMLNFELKPEWVKAHKEGYIHIHDIGSRFLKSHNCCLFNMEKVLKNGFQLNGIQYAEPGGVQSAFNVASDVVLSASAQQYGRG